MRYARGHKKETREQILEAAARSFREHGLEGISLGQLMGQLGLTHGGFYAHFKSKDALITEMLKQASASNSAMMMQEAAATAAPKDELASVIRFYLSADHRDHPDIGCLMPALGAEVARQSRPIRSAFTRAVKGLLTWLSGVRRHREVESYDEDLIPLIATLVGAITLARAVEDKEFSDRILALCQDRLLREWSKEAR